MTFERFRLGLVGLRRSALVLGTMGLLVATAVSQGAPPEQSAAKADAHKKPQPKREPIYNPKADAQADIEAALKAARLDHKRVLVTYGGNWCSWCYKLHDLFKSDKQLATILRNEYVQVLIDVKTQQKLFDHYVKKSEQHGFPFLTVLDSDGQVLVNQETGALEAGPKHDPTKVKTFLKKWSAPAQDAEAVFAAGLAQAKRESKRVFLHIGAPWCGWCRVLERFLRANDNLFEADFVDLKIDQDRMTQAAKLIKRLRPAKSSGIPWIAILDADGNTLATSDMPKMGNTGFPSEPDEIKHFVGMLRTAGQRTTPEQLATIEKKLNQERARRERSRSIHAAASSPKPST
jgi:thiol:disulfide interchange protein